jgi:carboxypeptidase Taq
VYRRGRSSSELSLRPPLSPTFGTALLYRRPAATRFDSVLDMDPAKRFADLRTRLGEISDLTKTMYLLSWDQHVMMPAGGAPTRAAQLETVGRIRHQKFIDPEIGRMLDDLRDWGEQHEYDSFEASLIRVTTRDWNKATRVPADLSAARTRASADGYAVWVEAREKNDYSSFLPALRENIDLCKRYVECFDPADEPYDILLDDFERDLKTAEVRRIFEYVKEHQGPLIREYSGAADGTSGPFSRQLQEQFEREVIGRFGWDAHAWRLDETVHPFASGTAIDDIRLTTRYFDDNLDGLFGTMHEFGHGLYEHQVDKRLERTPLARGVSLGMHESQSRMWENLVGRSLPFWRHWFPRLQELYPHAFEGYDAERWYAEVNTVQPSLIRVEADEVTYNFHIILRFELEQELINGTIDLEKLPEEWNSRMWDYLGIEVPDDTHGVLQDVHWSGGSLGYFSTYALGNLISAQLWEKITADIPDIYEAIGEGEYTPLREWLGENLHRHGRKFTPAETLERVVGTPKIDPEPYVRYLREKFSEMSSVTTS